MPNSDAVPNNRTPEQARLFELLTRATSFIGDALADARRAHEELAQLVAVGERRPLDGRERTRYADLEHAERVAANRYLAARHWRDAVTARLRDMRLREDEAAGPAA
jgi:hypothetical protein